MPSIESLDAPLVYKVKGARPGASGVPADRVWRRAELRALDGMQKEALVRDRATGTAWRMVCDEGPYLNGTDLAPFPLAFFTAGVVFSLMTEIQRHAEAGDLALDTLAVSSDHFYTMEGSALRGDMIGGAKPVEIDVDLGPDAGARAEEVLAAAQASSPAEAYLRDRLRNTFSLTADGSPLELVEPPPSSRRVEDPAADFDRLEAAAGDQLDDIIAKVAAAEAVDGVEGGAGSSLKAEQKRTLHVRGEARLVDGTLKEIRVHLFQPIGSSFRFFSDAGADGRAPDALAYLSAGVGFCFMTQIGRYAHIARKRLTSYRVVQDNVFHVGGARAAAEPVDTHVFLSLDDEPDEVARKIVYMSERTCFLHAAMRGAHPSRIRAAEPVD